MSETVMENIIDEDGMEVAVAVDTTHEKYLTFVSDGLTYGVSTNYVIEIITNYTITTLPIVPNYVKGIINLRGQIIPIIDIRLRMYKPAIEFTSTSCIIVLNINSIYIGIIVDSVSQVIDIDETEISSMPTNNTQELVSGMCSLASGVVLFLDCELLIKS